MSECRQCNFDKPVRKGRAHYCCPDCGRDYSLEMYFLYKAQHPEQFEDLDKAVEDSIEAYRKKNK